MHHPQIAVTHVEQLLVIKVLYDRCTEPGFPGEFLDVGPVQFMDVYDRLRDF